MGALRLLLAASVVLYHAHGLFHVDLVGGVAAVETFFMISGFVMALVLATKYDPAADRRLFYTNRLLRIYVPYLAILLFALAVAAFAFVRSHAGPFAAWQGAAPTPATWLAMAVSHLTIVGQDAFLFLKLDHGALHWSGAAPGLNVVLLQLLPPAWSISLELVFYAFAPWLARLRSRTLVGLLSASLGLRLLLARAGLPFDPWCYCFLPVELAFFVAGMLAYRLYAARPRRPGRDRALGLVVLAAVLAYQPASLLVARLGAPAGLARWGFYALAFAGLPALFAWSGRSRLDRFLGDFSYPLYLVHWPTLVLIDALSPGLDANARAGAGLAVSLALAFAVAELIEKPVDRFRQRRFAERAAAPGPSAALQPEPVLRAAAGGG
jgi:peptidoglycan/LPS O-acetylase OafA/YrhL